MTSLTSTVGPVASILFLDSLSLHDMEACAEHIRGWLDREWERLNKGEIPNGNTPFAREKVPCLSPTGTLVALREAFSIIYGSIHLYLFS